MSDARALAIWAGGILCGAGGVVLLDGAWLVGGLLIAWGICVGYYADRALRG